MNSDERIKILRWIQQAHELVHIMAFDTICETAGWAADEIERLLGDLALQTELRRDAEAQVREERAEVAVWLCDGSLNYPFDFSTDVLPPVWLRRAVENRWVSLEAKEPPSADEVRAVVAEEGRWSDNPTEGSDDEQ